jgi:SAM-dependent methyltransferase
MKLDKDFWDTRYKSNETGWDIGYPSPPIINYFKILKNKNLKILIPGAGNSYEAEAIYKLGFTNIYVLDLSPTAINNFLKRFPDFPKENIFIDDFFNHEGHYDIIVEQTFFCAIDPSLRNKYVKKMHQLLSPNGRLIGLLFDDPLNTDHPPFGGNKEVYLKLFSPYFDILKMDTAPDSIPQRLGRELFIELKKK